MRPFGLGDVFVNADVVGQFPVVTVNLGDRHLAPIGFEIFASAFELALPAIAFAQARMRIEQEVAEVLQRGQLAQFLALDFV